MKRNRYEIVNANTGVIEYAGLTSGEVQTILGMPTESVSRYAIRGWLFRSTWRIRIDKDEYEEIWTDEVCMHWECVRKMVLGGLRIKRKRWTSTLKELRSRHLRKSMGTSDG